MIKNTSYLILLLLLLATPATAQISYNVTFPNAPHHEAEIEVTLSGIPAGPLALRMSRTSPGRYSLHEFAKNVYNVRATNSAGETLDISRPNPHQWDIHGHDGTVTVHYTLYADRSDGTYAQIDASHAHLNMPATFMFARDLHNWPITVMFDPPEAYNWKIATQLFTTEDPYTFTAPNLQYFMDSPTELSNFSLRTWPVPRSADADETYQIRLAIHHTGTEKEVDEYADMVRRVVEQQFAVFGGPPAYDSGTYTFIADYLPWAAGDGMEHRNSTILTSTGSLEQNAQGLLGTVSHEFFHSWNVERIRPAALEPFDFEEANMSPDLWFAEGFTSYYTPLFIRRAGITDDADYARALSGGLSFVINSPARDIFNPMEMSMQAPFADRASSVDPLNFTNTFISYYTWGSVIGLNLDLTLRGMDKSLDGFMEHVWQKHGKPEIPYAVPGLEIALAEYTGDKAFARDFFARYIYDSEVPDYGKLLGQAGFHLQKQNPGQAYAGSPRFSFEDEGIRIESNTVRKTPLYDAGLDRGDLILSVDGKTFNNRDAWDMFVSRHKPGEMVDIVYEQRGERKTGGLTFTEDPALEVVPFENADRTLTDTQRAFRSTWLDGK